MQAQDDLNHLDAGARAVGRLAARPHALVYITLGSVVAIAWAVLGVMALKAAAVAPDLSGPGGNLLAFGPQVNLPAFFDRLFTLCLTPAVTAGPAKAFVLWSMWFLMAVAMMLPSAAPLIRTYCEIADTARTKRQLVVHPFVLIAGYLLVWLVAALGFAAATMFIQGRIALSSAPAPLTGFAGAAALALAGLYQFSSLKLACLEKCRHPFAILFSRWSTRPAAVFRLGIEQGGWCLGCCWALMFVMFAVGIMNIFWMALGAVFAVVEKQVEGHLASRLAGAILLVWALALLVVSA